MDFMGFSNVNDVQPIFGADGIADGFIILHTVEKKLRNGMMKTIERKSTVYVREFNPNAVGNDGTLHGFGRGTVYSRSSGKKRGKKLNLSAVQSIVSGR